MILFNQIGIFDQEWLWKESNNVLCFLHKNSHKEMVPSKSATFIWVWSCKLKPEFHFGSSVGVPNERLNFSVLFFKLQFITQRFWLKTKMLSFSQLAEPYISNLINLLDFWHWKSYQRKDEFNTKMVDCGTLSFTQLCSVISVFGSS